MRFGLSEETIFRINEVLAGDPEVERATLFGSRAKGCHQSGSDIDLSSVGDVDRRLLAKIADELDDLLLPYDFSLSVYGRIVDSAFREHIDRVGITFHDRSSMMPCNIESGKPSG